MNDAPPTEEPTRRKSRMPLVLGLGLALLLGGGGFYAAFSGMLDPWLKHEGASEDSPLPGIAFVPIDSVIVNLGPDAAVRHLKFTSQLEVEAGAEADVTLLKPRILDILNSYLHAIPASRIEDPTSITLIRAQLLRRIQIVTGTGRVRDLLITEYVLN